MKTYKQRRELTYKSSLCRYILILSAKQLIIIEYADVKLNLTFNYRLNTTKYTLYNKDTKKYDKTQSKKGRIQINHNKDYQDKQKDI